MVGQRKSKGDPLRRGAHRQYRLCYEVRRIGWGVFLVATEGESNVAVVRLADSRSETWASTPGKAAA